MPNRTLTALTVLMTLLALNPQNLLATAAFEDGFEDGLSSEKWFWDLHNWRGTKTIVTTNPHSGSNALYMEGADWHPQCSYMRSQPVVSLESARIEFWYRDITLNAGGGGDGHVNLQLYDDSSNHIGSMREQINQGDHSMGFTFSGGSWEYTGLFLRNQSGWNKLSVLYAPAPDQTTVDILLNDNFIQSFSINQNKGNLGSVFLGVGGQYHNWAAWTIDDVRITAGSSEVPEPATLLAGLAGLAGIGRYLRRRK